MACCSDSVCSATPPEGAPNSPQWRRALWIALAVNAGFFVAEIAAGAAASLGLTRYLATLLYAVKPTDPAVFGTVAAILALAAAAGCWFPARRATTVDPAVVLREE